QLWPADTYVDFEHSLNAAIKRLRAALGDSAESPRFVETLARRGYRFIAPLSQPAEEPQVETQAPKRPGRRHMAPASVAGLFVLAIIGFSVTALRDRLRGAVSTPIRSLAVLPLANLSGDPAQDAFVDGMTDALGYALEGINKLRVISRTSSMHYRG